MIVGRLTIQAAKVVDVNKVPEPWATRLIERGYTDRRSTKSAVPSAGALADDLGWNTSTVTEAFSGKRRPRPETIAALVEKLGDDVAQWLGAEHFEAWEPPGESALLSPPQREAIEHLIRVMADDRKAGSDGSAPEAQKSDDEVERRRKARQARSGVKKAARTTTKGKPKPD